MKTGPASASPETIDIPHFLKTPPVSGVSPAKEFPPLSMTPPSDAVRAGSRPFPGDLPSDGFERVFVMRLHGVDGWSNPDVADRIYEAPGAWMGKGDRIANRDTGNRRQRLRAVLGDSTTLGVQQDSRTLRIDYQSFTPQDFMILVPRQVYDSHLDRGGVAIAYLTDRIRARIEHDYGGRFAAQHRGANVVVAPADLPIDEVVVMFGPTVFIPNARDVRLFDLSVAVITASGVVRPKEGFAHTIVKPVPGMRACASETRPAGLYEGQSSFLLGTDETMVPNVLPGHLALPQGLTVLISLSPDRARGDGVHLAREGRVEIQADGTRVFRFGPAQPARTPGQKLSFEVTLRPLPKVEILEAAAADAAGKTGGRAPAGAGGRRARPGLLGWLFGWRKAGVTNRSPTLAGVVPPVGRRAGETRGGETIVIAPDHHLAGTTNPHPMSSLSKFRVSVVGIALPRLPAGGGAENWAFAVTPTGDIVPQPPAGAFDSGQRLTLLGGNAGDPLLYVIAPGKEDWEVVDSSLSRPLHRDGNGGELLPLAAPLTDCHHMLLILPRARHFPLLAGVDQLIGRQSDAEPGPGLHMPKIQFGLLDLPNSVKGAAHGSLGVINFSRDHVRAVVTGDRMELFMHAGKTSIWRLDEAFRPLEERRAGEKTALTLAVGEHLLIGYYVVRFTTMDGE